MNFCRISLAILLACFSIISCSKNADSVSPIVVDPVDTISYPYNMKLIRVWPKGTSRIFSNHHEIMDSIYAMTFIFEAAVSFQEYFIAPKSLNFISKDTVSWIYSNQFVNFGIHTENGVFKLYPDYTYPQERLKDSTMIELIPDILPGKFRSVSTSYGNNKEYKIPVFAYKLRQYERYQDYYSGDTVRFRHEVISASNSLYKESYGNTLSSLDTFAIQEYEMVFK